MLNLARVRKDKTLVEVATNMGIRSCVLVSWESGGILPPESRISLIAQNYGIDEKTLRETYLLARKERDDQVISRRNIKKGPNLPKNEREVFSGKIESGHVSNRLNPRLNRIEK